MQGTYKIFVKPHAYETAIFHPIPNVGFACRYVRGGARGCNQVSVSAKSHALREKWFIP